MKRIGYLLAKRLVGDIELGLDPLRAAGDGNPAWARMDFPGRRLPGLADQSIYDSSAIQKFELGTKREVYGRVFRYAKAGADLTYVGLERLVANGNYTPEDPDHEDEFGFYGDLKTAAEIGDEYVDLETATAYAVDYFKGGYFTTWNSNRPVHYVVASDLGNGTYCRIYLDEPLRVAISATAGVEVYRSPYSNIIEDLAAQSFKSFVGVAHCGAVASGSYFWLQTKGPCWITPYNWDTGLPGYAANKRDCYAWIDGTVTVQGTVGELQRIGYLLSATASGYGDVFIMLQLE